MRAKPAILLPRKKREAFARRAQIPRSPKTAARDDKMQTTPLPAASRIDGEMQPFTGVDAAT
jgi:hypothetical protein